MLVVRAAQLAAFERDTRRRFTERAAVLLRRHFPAACGAMSEDQLHAFVGEGIARAKGYLVVTERDVLKYLGLMIALGRDFDELPWAAPTLAETRVDGEVRMRLLCEEARWRSTLEEG